MQNKGRRKAEQKSRNYRNIGRNIHTAAIQNSCYTHSSYRKETIADRQERKFLYRG
jgi:hypothetical protein